MFRRRTIQATWLCAALFAVSGCAGGPIEGSALERLKADVAATLPGKPGLLVVGIGPAALAGGGGEANVVMPFVSHETRVTEFALYDGYFKVAFAAVDELRSLGFDAALSPAIWGARADSLAFEMRGLDDDAVDRRLSLMGAHDDVQQIWKLSAAERRRLLISRFVLLSARSALPGGMKDRDKKSGREIRDEYFGDDGPPPAGTLALSIDAPTLAVRAEERTFSDGRIARARLQFRLARHAAGPLADNEVACDTETPDTGVRFHEARFSFTMGLEDPLETAIGGAVRAFVRDALPAMKGGR